jgi:transposase InsO family protein
MWVEPDIRDKIIEYVYKISREAEMTKRSLIFLLGITASRFYDWIKREGIPNNHNCRIPRKHWLLEEEKQAIINYCKERPVEGYRRLTYMMMDEDIVFVSPATTYRVLSSNGLIGQWKKTAGGGKKGTGFIQPGKIHKDWHTDIAYVNILGTFFFLMTVLDGYSRKVLHHELRSNMEEYDVEIVIRRAREQYPDAQPIIITDNGSQYVSKDFQSFIKESGLKQIRTSVRYPQSNGKIERFHKTIKTEKIRTTAMTSIEDARKKIAEYVEYYNTKRLHSSIYYLTPQEVFEGKMEERLAERQAKLDNAKKKRIEVMENRLSA